MKILFIQNVGKRVNSFSISSIYASKQLGLEYHIASNWTGYSNQEEINLDEEKYGITIHHIDFIRNPYDIRNIKAYLQVCNLINHESIDFIHCNTPIGGVVGRLAGKKCKVKKVIYQVHGFHFYEGAPLKNWLIYYPIEKWLAHYTDALITINREDYERAQGFKLRKGGKVYYVPGVGIDLSQYKLPENTREIKRIELGLKESDVALISAGELNSNKNNKVIIEALANLKKVNVHYFLCGVGPCEEELKELAQKKGITRQVHFLGYRTDMKELLRAADVFVMPSYREGLSRSIMEAMVSGLPCIASKIRGNTDLLEENNGGFLCKGLEEYVEALKVLSVDKELRKIQGKNNLLVIENYCIENVVNILTGVYRELLRK